MPSTLTFKQKMAWRLPVFAGALWWGSLTTIGFLVVPLLFMHLPTAALAGQTAAKLFSAQMWVSVACGFVLIFAFKPATPMLDDESAAEPQSPIPSSDGLGATGWVLAGLLLALLLEFIVAPRIVARENLALWHNAGSLMYLAQWVCASVALWTIAFKPNRL